MRLLIVEKRIRILFVVVVIVAVMLDNVYR